MGRCGRGRATALGLRHGRHDRKAETGTAGCARPRGIGTVEALEDVLGLVWSKTWTAVGDGQASDNPICT